MLTAWWHGLFMLNACKLNLLDAFEDAWLAGYVRPGAGGTVDQAAGTAQASGLHTWHYSAVVIANNLTDGSPHILHPPPP